MKNIDEYKNGPMSGDLPDTIREDCHQVEAIIQERSQTFNNLAAAQLKMQAFDSALRSVESCLLLAPKNVKALFRRAKILAEKGEIEKAISDLRLASTIDPKSEAIEFELQRLNNKLTRQNQEQRAMYRRMMKINDNHQNDDDDDDDDDAHNNGNASNNSDNKTDNSDKKKNDDKKCAKSLIGKSSKDGKYSSKTRLCGGLFNGSACLFSNNFTKGITILAILFVCFAVGIPIFHSYFK